MNNICQAQGIPLTIVSNRTATKVAADVALELFKHSDPTRKTGGKPLGLLAENQVIAITGALEERPEAMALLDTPVLHAYGSIEQSYLDLIKMTSNGRFVGSTGN